MMVGYSPNSYLHYSYKIFFLASVIFLYLIKSKLFVACCL